MKTCSNPRKTNRAGAFTLVELLVVIAIVIVLAAVVFTVTQSVRRSATKVADMNNLKNLATAVMAAGSDNAGKLPTLHSGSYAPYWIIGRATLQSYGIFKEACYIPRKGVVGGAPNYDWWFKVGSDTAVPVHYVYYANDADPGRDPWYYQGSLVKPKEGEYRGATPFNTIIKDKSKAFPSNFTDDAWYTILWSSMISEFPGRDPIAPVVDNKNKPLGMNVMYLDGHSEWVNAKSEKVKVRYTHPQGLKLTW